jgi:ADP-ribose pyrophosphatase YjhB (NUDIX family)
MPEESCTPHWLIWARQIHQIGQTGSFFAGNEFDRQRYRQLIDIAIAMISQHLPESEDQIRVALCAQPGYITPKVDVRAAVFREGKILMVREMADGLWSLPGGWADVNDAPSAMVEREVREESGLIVKARKLVGVFEGNHDREPLDVFHSYKLVFLCNYLSGDLQTSIETTAVDFFDPASLPPLSIHRTQERYIREACLHLQDPGKATVFD